MTSRFLSPLPVVHTPMNSAPLRKTGICIIDTPVWGDILGYERNTRRPRAAIMCHQDIRRELEDCLSGSLLYVDNTPPIICV
jgi:hypothetical protein